jgi:hypothetical protein
MLESKPRVWRNPFQDEQFRVHNTHPITLGHWEQFARLAFHRISNVACLASFQLFLGAFLGRLPCELHCPQRNRCTDMLPASEPRVSYWNPEKPMLCSRSYNEIKSNIKVRPTKQKREVSCDEQSNSPSARGWWNEDSDAVSSKGSLVV